MPGDTAPHALTAMASPVSAGNDEPLITKLAVVAVALTIGVAFFVGLMSLTRWPMMSCGAAFVGTIRRRQIDRLADRPVAAIRGGQA